MHCHLQLMLILVALAAGGCLKRFWGRRWQNPDGSKKPIGKQDVALSGCVGEIMEHDLRYMRN